MRDLQPRSVCRAVDLAKEGDRGAAVGQGCRSFQSLPAEAGLSRSTRVLGFSQAACVTVVRRIHSTRSPSTGTRPTGERLLYSAATNEVSGNRVLHRRKIFPMVGKHAPDFSEVWKFGRSVRSVRWVRLLKPHPVHPVNPVKKFSSVPSVMNPQSLKSQASHLL